MILIRVCNAFAGLMLVTIYSIICDNADFLLSLLNKSQLVAAILPLPSTQLFASISAPFTYRILTVLITLCVITSAIFMPLNHILILSSDIASRESLISAYSITTLSILLLADKLVLALAIASKNLDRLQRIQLIIRCALLFTSVTIIRNQTSIYLIVILYEILPRIISYNWLGRKDWKQSIQMRKTIFKERKTYDFLHQFFAQIKSIKPIVSSAMIGASLWIPIAFSVQASTITGALQGRIFLLIISFASCFYLSDKYLRKDYNCIRDLFLMGRDLSIVLGCSAACFILSFLTSVLPLASPSSSISYPFASLSNLFTPTILASSAVAFLSLSLSPMNALLYTKYSFDRELLHSAVCFSTSIMASFLFNTLLTRQLIILTMFYISILLIYPRPPWLNIRRKL